MDPNPLGPSDRTVSSLEGGKRSAGEHRDLGHWVNGECAVPCWAPKKYIELWRTMGMVKIGDPKN